MVPLGSDPIPPSPRPHRCGRRLAPDGRTVLPTLTEGSTFAAATPAAPALNESMIGPLAREETARLVHGM